MLHDVLPHLKSLDGALRNKFVSEANSPALGQQWAQKDLAQMLSSFDVQSFHYMNDVLFVGS